MKKVLKLLFFLNSLGITAAVLKYRLFREEASGYTIDHAKLDATREVMRNKANQWAIKKDRLGIIGFSAGGELIY